MESPFGRMSRSECKPWLVSAAARPDVVHPGAADGRRGVVVRRVRRGRVAGVAHAAGPRAAARPAPLRRLRAGRAGRVARGVRRARQAGARRVLQAHHAQLRGAARARAQPVRADPQPLPHARVRGAGGGGARQHRARDLHAARAPAHRPPGAQVNTRTARRVRSDVHITFIPHLCSTFSRTAEGSRRKRFRSRRGIICSKRFLRPVRET